MPTAQGRPFLRTVFFNRGRQTMHIDLKNFGIWATSASAGAISASWSQGDVTMLVALVTGVGGAGVLLYQKWRATQIELDGIERESWLRDSRQTIDTLRADITRLSEANGRLSEAL